MAKPQANQILIGSETKKLKRSSFFGSKRLIENSDPRLSPQFYLQAVLVSLFFTAVAASAADSRYGLYDRRKSFAEDEFSWATIAAGANPYYYNYKEEVTPPLKSTESGPLVGFHGELSIRPSKMFPYVRGRFDYTAMTTTYDGSLQDGTPTKGKTGNKIYNIEGILGVPIIEHLNLVVGYGYHSWLRRLGYDETYTWNYGVIGFYVGSRGENQNDEIGIGLEVTARPTFNGKMVVDFFEPPQYARPTLVLGRRVGFRIELPVDWPLSSSFSFVLSPYFERSSIGGSPWVYYEDSRRAVYIREPSSQTTQYGSLLLLALKL